MQGSEVQPQLTEDEIAAYKQEAEEWAGFFEIKTTPTFLKFINRPEKIIALFTGNQWGKNVNIVKQYMLRWMGKHPIASKNLTPETKIRTYRFCAEKKPNDKEGGDSNTIYPVLKKMWPKKLVKRDIDQRNSTMTLIEPYTGLDFFVEFLGYSQDIQVGAGHQRASVYIDENCKREFFNEQLPRLLASDGDLIIGMTPALGAVTWQYEDIFEQARVMIRSPRIRKRIKERFDEDKPDIEYTGKDTDICVIMAATDDNPAYDVLVKKKNDADLELIKMGKHHMFKTEAEFKPISKAEYIKSKLGVYDDETEDVRRYGIFRQVSGRIFKDFEENIHRINENKFFPDGVPHDWVHARGIDYHKHVDWHCGWAALSPNNEMFVYDELMISPEKFVTHQIARTVAQISKDYKYSLSLIDPLSSEMQVNTGISTLEDMNRIFVELKREGIGTGGYWRGWDTKGNRGQEEIKRRLHNSRICGVPFNNKQIVNGRLETLPTIWFFSKCRGMIEYMKNWRLEDWSDRSKLETKEKKETPMQRYSHYCVILEAICKEEGWKPRRIEHREERHTAAQYGRR